MVQYQVQYKPINPVTNNCVTNTTLTPWSGASSASGTTDPRYDMALMYIKSGQQNGNINYNDFKRIDSEIWAVYAVVDSVKAAMRMAKPLIREYGNSNVQICKVAPSNIEIVFEEGN